MLNVIYVIAAASWPAGTLLPHSFATVGRWILFYSFVCKTIKELLASDLVFMMKLARSSEEAPPSKSISSWSICLSTAHT